MAMRCAVDSEPYVDLARDGWGRADYGVWWSDSRWALPVERRRAIDICLDETVPHEQRLERGKQLMQEVGFGPDNRLSMDLLIRGTSFVFEPLQAWWEEFHFDVESRSLETARSYDASHAGEFDVHPSGFITAGHDPDTFLGEHYLSTSDRNYGKCTNPEVDVLIDLQGRTVDPKEWLALVHDLKRSSCRTRAS